VFFSEFGEEHLADRINVNLAFNLFYFLGYGMFIFSLLFYQSIPDVDLIMKELTGLTFTKNQIETDPRRCRERRKELLSSLKTLKNIKERDFDKQYYIEERLDINNKRDDVYKENYYMSYKVDNLEYSLNIMCLFSYNSWGDHTQLLHYALTAVDFENLVTDKDIIKGLNDQINEKRTVLKKPLSNEILKNDFRGL
jgi:hypothetical protein